MGVEAKATVAKTELIPFETVTVTREQFLQGKMRGDPGLIAGELRIPQLRGRVPAAVLLHGSSGIRSNVTSWAERFTSVGVASFIVDSFSGRGIGGTDREQSLLNATAMMVDAFNARHVLANHPRIDANKLLLIGVSKGGNAALHASMRRFEAICGAPRNAFAGYVALYPVLITSFLQEDDVADRPIRVYHGDIDDVAPIEGSRRYIRKLTEKKNDAELIELQGAHHLYDFVGQDVMILPNIQNKSRCFTEEREPGVLVNCESGEVDGPDDPRISLGGTFGYNADATARTVASVLDLCNQLFGSATVGSSNR